jgi:molybdenum cofactor cytidylyltransferase
VEKTVSVLRRRKINWLNTAEGLGMPFAVYKDSFIPYLKKYDSNLNPILRKAFDDGFSFYGVQEEDEIELLNINNYDEFKTFNDYLKK